MKKISSIVVILLMSLSLVACGNGGETKSAPEKEKNEKVTIYVTRHGKTMFNQVHRAQGWSDTPLTKDGRDVASDLGKGLKGKKIDFDAVYTSDSGRARETAELILKAMGEEKKEVNESPKLRENGFGIFEGDFDENMWGKAAKTLGYKDMDDLVANLDKVGLDKAVDAIVANDTSKQAETRTEVKKRMQAEMKEIAEKQRKAGGGKVLVVSHGMAITSMISDWTDADTDQQLPNASVTELTYENGKFTVGKIGDTSYIEE